MMNYRFILLVSGLLLTACSNEDFPLREQMKEARQKSDVIAATKNNVNQHPSDQEKNLVQETITDPYENIRHLLEKDAQLDERLTEKNILGIVGLIVGNGYKCDTVSAITPFPRKTGFYVMCNQYHYDYKVEDRGGNWMVTLN
ncbi:hypothetical protein ACT4U4_04990 [Acinetobacter baumannii]|nr:hypothetical protein [Acinetobacter baumannii]